MAATYEIGPFRLDTEAEVLFRGDKAIGVGQRAIALLGALVERAGSPVAKDALIEAAWPGLAIEESNLTVQIAALRRVFSAEPEGERWIETLPRRGYRFVGPLRAAGANADAATRVATIDAVPALPLPDKPSIAVLPFDNLSGDVEQEYFADGIVEEIITALSRFRHLFVIARNSSFTYKGRAVDVKQVGRELGVRYVLEGSVRKAADRVRISAQLIDAVTGKHLWADRFDGALADTFDLQDRVAASVVGAIAPTLEQAEIERARLKPTESLDAYDLYLRGMASLHQATKESNSEALRLFYEAIKLDPDFAHAHGMAAWCYAWRKLNGWLSDPDMETAEASRLALRATSLGKGDALALVMAGYALAHVVGVVEDAAGFADRAIEFNPNLAAAWLLSGWMKIYLGDPETAIKPIEHSIRLSPLDPLTFMAYSLIGLCHFLAERYEQALSWDEKSLREHPGWVPSLRRVAASHAMAGRMPQAQRAVERLLEINPAMRVSDIARTAPLVRHRTDLAKLMDGLRKAGLPE